MGVCCRHTRYTPAWSSWNPTGGYPELTDFPIIPKSERWQDIDDVYTSKGIQYCQKCDSDKDADEFMLVDQASNTTMGDNAAAAASSGARPSSSTQVVKEEQMLPDVEVSDDSQGDKEEAPMDLSLPNMPRYKEDYNSQYICCRCGARDLVNLPNQSRQL
eukprot:6471995-Amphidinium_carterae.1